MNGFRDRSLSLRRDAEARMQGSMDNKDWLGVERINEQRYWHDEIMKYMTAVDKADIHDEGIQGAAQKAMDIVQRMGERPANPEEMGFLESLFGARPRYQYQGRKPLTAPPKKGTAGPMSRQEQAPAKGAQAPVAVKDDADYAKLPSGTVFIGPDGKQRTKP